MDKSTATATAEPERDAVIKAHAAQRAMDDIGWRVFLSDLALVEAAQTLRANPDLPEAQRWDILCAALDASVEAFKYEPEPPADETPLQRAIRLHRDEATPAQILAAETLAAIGQPTATGAGS